jgi:hypothetical protein
MLDSRRRENNPLLQPRMFDEPAAGDGNAHNVLNEIAQYEAVLTTDVLSEGIEKATGNLPHGGGGTLGSTFGGGDAGSGVGSGVRPQPQQQPQTVPQQQRVPYDPAFLYAVLALLALCFVTTAERFVAN